MEGQRESSFGTPFSLGSGKDQQKVKSRTGRRQSNVGRSKRVPVAELLLLCTFKLPVGVVGWLAGLPASVSLPSGHCMDMQT